MQDNFNIHAWQLKRAIKEMDEATFTDKHDDNPKLKGDQKELPDELQAKILNKEAVTPLADLYDLVEKLIAQGITKDEILRIVNFATANLNEGEDPIQKYLTALLNRLKSEQSPEEKAQDAENARLGNTFMTPEEQGKKNLALEVISRLKNR